jgi:large subunit ribosomal protein L21
MYAVIKTGGKQYRVAKDDTLTVEKLAGDAGDTLTFEVLAIGDGDQLTLGDALKSASVTGEIVEQGRGDKIIVFKKKRRQNYRRKNGHRQHETLVKITGITA